MICGGRNVVMRCFPYIESGSIITSSNSQSSEQPTGELL